MVSRRFCYVDGLLWEPLVNMSRCVKRLVASENREKELEEQLLVGATMTLALQIYWQTRRNVTFYSSTVEALTKNFLTEGHLSLARARAADLYAGRIRQFDAGARTVRTWC